MSWASDEANELLRQAAKWALKGKHEKAQAAAAVARELRLSANWVTAPVESAGLTLLSPGRSSHCSPSLTPRRFGREFDEIVREAGDD